MDKRIRIPVQRVIFKAAKGASRREVEYPILEFRGLVVFKTPFFRN